MIDRAREGEGGVLLIQGPAGVGKTTLLDHASNLGRSRDFHVLTARGHHLERDFPYGVVRQLFEPALIAAFQDTSRLLQGPASAALAVLPETSERGPPAPRDPEQVQARHYAALHGLYWFCYNLAEDTPVLIAVDDSQWADIPSQRFLLYLARRLDRVPVVIALTHREGEGSGELLDELASEPATELLRPKPLGPEAVAAIVQIRLSAPPAPEFVDACLEATGGNPFLLRELLREIEERGVQPTADQARAIPQLPLPGVSKALTRRVRQVGPEAIHLARALALLGSGASLQEAATLAGMALEHATDVADILSATEILKPGTALEFVHPLVRAAIYDDIPPAKRRLLHGEAARLLAKEGAPVDRVAAHLLEAEPLDEPWPVEVLRRGASQAVERGAPASAVAYLRRALAEPPGDDQRAPVLLELGEAEVGVDPPAAVEHLTAALDLASDPQKRASICVKLLHAHLQVETVAKVVDSVRACIAGLGVEEAELTLTLEAELVSALRQGLATSPLADESIHRWQGRISGRTASERLMLTHLAAHNALRGANAETVARIAEQALGNGRLLADQSSGSLLYYLPIYQLICADRFDDAELHLEQALRDAQSRGSPLAYAMVSVIRSSLAFARGHLGDAEADARRALGDGRRLGWSYGVPAALEVLISVLVDQGNLDEANRLVSDLGMAGELPDTVPYRLLLGARGRLRQAHGMDHEALRDFTELMRREEQLGPSNLFLTPYRSWAALTLHGLDRHEEAGRLMEECLRWARGWGAPRGLAMALRHAATIQWGAGLELLEEAVAATERSEANLEKAHCLVDYGAALRRAGRRAESVPILRRGLELAHRCRASPLERRAREELIVLGTRPRRFATTGVESLTASERRVVEMAAGGMSNRAIAQALFVTNRTVELHLTHAYQKLGITSRDELGDAMQREAV